MNVTEFGPAPRNNGLSYPGKRPKQSYILYKDSVQLINPTYPIQYTKIDTVHEIFTIQEFLEMHNRNINNMYCVIGYGSNVCPAQLYDKFKDTIMLILRGTICNYDIVYANTISRYGSIPATIIDSPGTSVQVWANILDDNQLDIMDESEGRDISYYLVKLNGTVHIDGLGDIDSYSYVYHQGALNYNNKPIRISDIPVQNPIYDGLTQIEMLELFSNMIGENRSAETQLENNIKYQDQYIKKLHNISSGIHVQYEHIPKPNKPPVMNQLRVM